MNLKKTIGQLFVVGFPGKEMTPEVKRLIEEYHVGGIILFAENIGTPQEVLKLTNDLQTEAKNAGYEHPLLIAIDEENGTVKRLGEGAGEYPGAMSLGATQEPDYAYEMGEATGSDLKALGINWNFAPVLDVNNNPDNPVIGVRSYGEDPKKVAEFGVAAMHGLQKGGVATAIKHFPGHGDTNTDSHYALPVINHSIERLRDIELVPFKAAISDGADSVMTAHIVFPALEAEKGLPATLSKNVLTGLLRNELDFQGVIVTDALEMEAISSTVGISDGAVKAFMAGADSLLIGHLPEEQFKALDRMVKAVEDEEVSPERVEESIQRLNKLKGKYTNWSQLDLDNAAVSESFNHPHKQERSRFVYEKSVTVLKEGETATEDMSVLVLQPKNELRTIAEDVKSDDFVLARTVKKYFKNSTVELVTNQLTANEMENIKKKAKSVDRVIVGTMVATKTDDLINVMKELSLTKTVDVIAMKSPYISQWIEHANYRINTYEPSSIPVEIAVQTLLGKVNPTGSLPVTLK